MMQQEVGEEDPDTVGWRCFEIDAALESRRVLLGEIGAENSAV